MAKPALLMTGPMMPLIVNGCDAAFTVHRLWEAADREALLKQVAPEIRAICTGGHTGVKTDDALMGRFPNLKIVGNFGVGYDSVDAAAAARRGVDRHQHARRADRGGGRHHAGAPAHARCASSTRAEKWLRDGRWAKEGDYRLTPGVAARPLGRHRRARPHRQGDRAAAGGLRRAGQLFRPQPAGGRRLPLLRRPGGHGARRRHADRGDARRAGDAEPDQRGRAGRAGAARHPHQHLARLGGGRGGADRGPEEAHHPGGRPRRVSRASRSSTRRSWSSTTSPCSRTWARPPSTRATPWASWWWTTSWPSPRASRPRRRCRRRRSRGGE